MPHTKKPMTYQRGVDEAKFGKGLDQPSVQAKVMGGEGGLLIKEHHDGSTHHNPPERSHTACLV